MKILSKIYSWFSHKPDNGDLNLWLRRFNDDQYHSGVAVYKPIAVKMAITTLIFETDFDTLGKED